MDETPIQDFIERHPKLTLTDMYNVLEKLRAGGPLYAKEQLIHEQGLVSVLRQIHVDLDAAVAEAYGWPANLSDEELLTRLVALNAERAAEERRGLIRWLRPDFQNAAGPATQTGLDTGPDDSTAPAAGASAFKGARADRVEDLLGPSPPSARPAPSPTGRSWPCKRILPPLIHFNP